MTFTSEHYVPVLKVKRGEKAALRAVAPNARKRITPLLEIVARKPDRAPTVDKHLDTSFAELADSVNAYSRCFLDAKEIASDGPKAAKKVFDRAAAEGIEFAPVTGISRIADVAAAMAYRKHGLVLRVTRQEFEAGGLEARIAKFLTVHGLKPEEIDLIVDLGAVEMLIAAGIMTLTQQFLAEVPDHKRWRSLTLSGCAFPMSMGTVDAQSYAQVPRAEWIAWKDGLFTKRAQLARLPTFSDCAIQHPKGVEDFDPRFMQASAAVRYTLDAAWLLIKGRSTRHTSAKVQFPKLARHLVRGQCGNVFCGPEHCQGCSSMVACAGGAPKLGSPEVWRRLGTIHHLTKVTEGLRALPWT